MYVNKVGSLNRTASDVFDFVEGNDIFNSKFIYELSNYEGSLYKINIGEGRLDLILKENLGTNQNYGINYILNRITDNDSIKIGKLVELMNENQISAIKNLL